MVANTLRMVLMVNRHRVEIVESGESAMALYAEGKYDLVITDFLMSGMDGLELARLIKERVPQQPIVVVTAHAETVSKDDRRRLHIEAVLEKPFSVEQLQEVLAAIFPGG